MPRKTVFVVVDGLTAATFENAVGDPGAPTLTALAEAGTYRRAVSVFPSLTPVCMSSIVTGAFPDVHHIPHLVWYDRAEQRLVEYGSSLGAVLSAGAFRSLRDTIFTMNERHLASDAVTLFEALEDAGLIPAAVNATCYRGRTRHLPIVPGLTPPAFGPRRFFYYNLFESDVTGAPLAIRNRAAGSVDLYAAAVGRWLVTRDGFDFLFYYLSDYDFASHLFGPEDTRAALAASDRAVGAIVDAAGGLDAFLERYAVVLCSDHGQTRVTESAFLEHPFRDLALHRRGNERWAEVAVAASNRAGMVYRLARCRESVRELALRLDGAAGVGVAAFLEDGVAIARSAREEVSFGPDDVECELLGGPQALRRLWAALHNPNAGDVLVSAADGFEFADLAGHTHLGGGSHGSLGFADSDVPVVTVGVDGEAETIADLAPLVLDHFGVVAPAHGG